jgi:tetratricopeptide (TPR) repeat protein
MRNKTLVLALLLSAGQFSPATAHPLATATTAKSGAAVASQDKPDKAKREAAYQEFLQALQYETEGDFVQAVETYKKVIALDVQSAQPRVALGELYLRNRNLNDAETQARTAIKLDQDNIGAHRLLGRILTSSIKNSSEKAKIQEAIGEFQQVSRLDKQEPEAWKFLAGLYDFSGEPEKALEAYQQLASLGFATATDYYEMARLHYTKGQYRESSKAARQAFEQSENNARPGVLLADSLLRSGQTAEAIEILRNILRSNPNDAALALGLAEALVQAGNYDEANQQLTRILEKSPKNIRALNLLAQSQRRLGKREQAISTLKRALDGQDVSESLEIQFELAETYEEMGQIDNAVAAYEEALQALSDPDGSVSASNKRNAGIVLQAIVNVYRNNNLRDKAFKALDRMQQVLGKDSTSATELRIAILNSEGQYKEALTAARDAQKQFPNERRLKILEAQALSELREIDNSLQVMRGLLNSSAEDGDIYNLSALFLMDNNQLAEAEKQVRKALQLDEKNTGYLLTLSSVQDRAKQYQASEDTLKLVLKFDPDNSTALNNLGYFLTERNERLKEALEYIQRAVNIEPNNGSFLDSLGWAYYKLGNLDLARKHLEEALIYSRRSTAIHEHLGDVYQKLGRTADAIKHWQKALEFTINPEETARLKEKLKDPKNVAAVVR